MKINFKNILIIDFIIICSVVAFFFNGQKITDAFAFGPEKPIYKTFLGEIESLIAQAKLLDPDTLDKKIGDINTEFINRSEVLYGVKLDGTYGSINNLEQVLEKTNSLHIYQGELTLYDFYIGEIIRTKTNSRWAIDENKKFYLMSDKNGEKATPYDFVIERYFGGTNQTAQKYVDDSINKIGSKK